MDRRDLRRIRLLQKFGEVARWTIGLGRLIEDIPEPTDDLAISLISSIDTLRKP